MGDGEEGIIENQARGINKKKQLKLVCSLNIILI